MTGYASDDVGGASGRGERDAQTAAEMWIDRDARKMRQKRANAILMKMVPRTADFGLQHGDTDDASGRKHRDAETRRPKS